MSQTGRWKFLDPNETLRNIREEISKIYSNLTTEFHTEKDKILNPPFVTTGKAGFEPPVDLCETSNTFEVIMELPGFREDEIDIEVIGNIMKVRGKQFYAPEGAAQANIRENVEFLNRGDIVRWHTRERKATIVNNIAKNFERTIVLPEGFDASGINMDFGRGLLRLSIPKFGGKSSQHFVLMGQQAHDTSRLDVLKLEEQERMRRIREDKQLTEEELRSSRSNLDEIRRLEEQERRSRMKGDQQAENLAHNLSNVVRQEFLGSSRQRQMTPSTLFKGRRIGMSINEINNLEEQERNRRMSGDNEGKQAARNLFNLVKSNIVGKEPSQLLRRSKLGGGWQQQRFSQQNREFVEGWREEGLSKRGVSDRYEKRFTSGRKTNVDKLEEEERRRRMAGDDVGKRLARDLSNLFKGQFSKQNWNKLKHIDLGERKQSFWWKSQQDQWTSDLNIDELDRLEEEERKRRMNDNEGKKLATDLAAMFKKRLGNPNWKSLKSVSERQLRKEAPKPQQQKSSKRKHTPGPKVHEHLTTQNKLQQQQQQQKSTTEKVALGSKESGRRM